MHGSVTALKEDDVEVLLMEKSHQVAYSQILCGENQSVHFKEIFQSWTKLHINKDEYGTALACAPYITLAQGVYPKGSGGAKRLVEMLLSEWEEEILLPKDTRT